MMNTTETFDLVDIGLNLVHKQFQSDRYAVLERARKAGVRRAILTGVSVRASEAAAALAAQHAGRLWSTAGVHPHEAKSCDNHTLPTLRRLAALPQVRAIGECGLDYNRDFSPREVQRQWFEAQVELAAELGMPLFVHERDALDDTVAVLEPHFAKVPGAVIHCFTGNEESLDRYLELGMHIGITGWICDERRGLHLREIVSRIPLDKLMLETDAPYLIPRSMRPKAKSGRNEPSYLTWVLAAVAEAYGLSEQEVAEQTTKTAERFFDLGERGADSGAQS